MTDEKLNEIRERRIRLPEGPPGNYLALIRTDIFDLMNAVRDLKCSVNGRDTRLSRLESLYYIQKCELQDVKKRLLDAKHSDDGGRYVELVNGRGKAEFVSPILSAEAEIINSPPGPDSDDPANEETRRKT